MKKRLEELINSLKFSPFQIDLKGALYNMVDDEDESPLENLIKKYTKEIDENFGKWGLMNEINGQIQLIKKVIQ